MIARRDLPRKVGPVSDERATAGVSGRSAGSDGTATAGFRAGGADGSLTAARLVERRGTTR
ncbi:MULTISPECIES: hypothetical protein [Protofrankia]|uniref:Uncharacterized protein n=1 Tax=Candidatus Protofrankia datiscae TaxID=2716812 RepID=F8AWX4_9ACTN|nr:MULTISPECIES: hypothetical protein [Protofrankia]AEH11418.1 hypothetical protein FsymDg_4148 [Candidatus Protofrankia datiscae]